LSTETDSSPVARDLSHLQDQSSRERTSGGRILNILLIGVWKSPVFSVVVSLEYLLVTCVKGLFTPVDRLLGVGLLTMIEEISFDRMVASIWFAFPPERKVAT